jgi:hypothetical protein
MVRVVGGEGVVGEGLSWGGSGWELRGQLRLGRREGQSAWVCLLWSRGRVLAGFDIAGLMGVVVGGFRVLFRGIHGMKLDIRDKL